MCRLDQPVASGVSCAVSLPRPACEQKKSPETKPVPEGLDIQFLKLLEFILGLQILSFNNNKKIIRANLQEI